MTGPQRGASASLASVESVLATVLAAARPTAVESVALAEAWGRVLADDVSAAWAIPGCDNSAMDGYAVRAADCAGASAESPSVLPIHGEARTGRPAGALVPGAVMAIATGAPLPRGADAVVPVENTDVRAGGVAVLVPAAPGDHVRRAGQDARPGVVVAPRGRRLRAIDLAACAAAGSATLRVHRRPRVAILGGGDELVPPGVRPEAHQVVDSNSALLMAAVREAGGEPMHLGVMPDDRDSVRRQLLEATGCDLVISTAGVSVGAHDHVRSVVEEVGTVLCWRVAMRPGKPLLVAEMSGRLLLGLPGNPVSSAVTFELFGRPAILASQGASTVSRRQVAVRMGEPVSTPRELATYLRVRLEEGADAVPLARLSGEQGSAMLRSLADADALAVVPAGVADVATGTMLAALELS